jgi:hypothetical protein
MPSENLDPAPAQQAQEIVTLTHLERGISKWREQRGWPADFHNSLYGELHERLEQSDFLDFVVRQLSAWRALRPTSQAEIIGRINERLEAFNCEFLKLWEKQPQRGLTLDAVEWAELEPLFAIATDIKPSGSQVFGSKFCHFLFPGAYPARDNVFTGLDPSEPYAAYWTRCAIGWRDSAERDRLVTTLRKAMGVKPVDWYPWGTKIGELCHAGARAGI